MGKCFFLFVFYFFSVQSFGQEKYSVTYNPEKRLDWSDFQGVPDYADPSKAAQISTTIQLKSIKVNFWTGKARFVGSAVMYSNKSWVKPGFRNAYVLRHEQIHFDIAYIAAKCMERDINRLHVNILNKDLIDAIYRNWHTIYLLHEKTYDLMTDGGNDEKMQLYFEQMTDAQIQRLQESVF